MRTKLNILHYSLGFPPFRRGGMTKYALDLMAEERRRGNKVALLWPGGFGLISSMPVIKQKNSFRFNDETDINSFELINPLPVPLLNGIQDIAAYTAPREKAVFVRFFKEYGVDIFHVHTLMGLPKEALQACDDLGIGTVFTTHDYFGICPKWSLERNGLPCVNDHECIDCNACNSNALSLTKVKFLQSYLYRSLKQTAFIKYLRARNNEKLALTEDIQQKAEIDFDKAEKYRELRKFYIDILSSFSLLHFNSTLTKSVYSRYISQIKKGVVISITHDSIADRRSIRTPRNPLRFGYLGPADLHKGYGVLIDTCDSLASMTKETFQLHTFVGHKLNRKYLVEHEPYNYKDLDEVMDSFDLLIVPSRWYETFGFTVLEAMSFGVPAVLTENVGAKDLIEDGVTGMIVKLSNDGLFDSLLPLLKNPELVKRMSEGICSKVTIKTEEKHCDEILELYTNLK